MKLKGLKINFLGDSITEGVGTTSPDNIYHALLKKEAGLKIARNYGIGGTRFAIQKGTPERPKDNYVDINSFCERFDQMDDDADVVVVFGGTNDSWANAPLGEMMYKDWTTKDLYCVLPAIGYLLNLLKEIENKEISLLYINAGTRSPYLPVITDIGLDIDGTLKNEFGSGFFDESLRLSKELFNVKTENDEEQA